MVRKFQEARFWAVKVIKLTVNVRSYPTDVHWEQFISQSWFIQWIEILPHLLTTICHFWDAPSLCVKVRLSVKLLIWKLFFILMQIISFLKKGFVLGLLKARVFGTQKWPIAHLIYVMNDSQFFFLWCMWWQKKIRHMMHDRNPFLCHPTKRVQCPFVHDVYKTLYDNFN